MSYLPDDIGEASPQPATRGSLGRFFGLTSLGTVIPGSGLIAAGWRRSGGAVIGVFILAAIAVGAFVYWKGVKNAALYFAVRPRAFLILTIAAGVLLALWVLSIVLTGWAARARSRGVTAKAAMTLFVGFLCALLIVPGAVAAQRAQVARTTVSEIFAAPKLPKSTTATTNTPAVDEADPWEGISRVNILLLGTDAYPGRDSRRTDTMMVASVDTATGDTLLIGIPRNMQGWRLPEDSPMLDVYPSGKAECSEDNADDCMLTDFWYMVESYAKNHPKAFGSDKMPSLTQLQAVISGFVGLPIDNTVMINIQGFSELVNALGGVDINVREALPIGGSLLSDGSVKPGSIKGTIQPGLQHLDGYHAMWYARSRVSTDDFSRMRRQRCVVSALVRQTNAAKLVVDFPAIAKVLKDNLELDISLTELPAWADLAERVQKGKIRSLPFTSKLFNNTDPDYDWVHQYIAHALDTKQPAPTTDGFGRPLPTKKPTPSVTTRSGTPVTAPAEGVVDIDDAC